MVVTNQFGKVLIVFSLLLSVYGCVPNGTRTSFVTNDTCHIGTTGWVYRLNDFIVSGGRVIPRPQEIDSYHACSSQRNRDRVIESEKALSIDNTGYPHIRIEGEVCADIPTLVLEVGGAFLTQQIQGPNGQVLNSVVMEFTTIPLSFGGSIDGLSPFSIFLQLASIGPNDTFFTDANSMITDTSLLSLNDYEGGLITLNFVGGDHTALAFGPNDPFSIVLQPVPIPAAIWLFASALGVLGYRARFNAGKAH